MNKKIFVLLVGTVLLVGIISGCIEEEKVANKKPTASFAFLPTIGIYVGVEITFTDASTDGDGTIAAWSWNFGDGTTSNESGPIKQTYNTPGTYTVKLIVTDDDGADSEEYSATVEVTNVPPSVEIEYSIDTTNLTVDSVITFTANVTKGDANISTYDWDFGDGNTSNMSTYNHTYLMAQDYTVSVTVTDENGLTATDTMTITVDESETT